MPKAPTLPDAFAKWPALLQAFHGLSKAQTESCLTWGIGEDWRDLRIDYVPERVMRRLKIAVSLDQDPVDILRAIRECWDRALLDHLVRSGAVH